MPRLRCSGRRFSRGYVIACRRDRLYSDPVAIATAAAATAATAYVVDYHVPERFEPGFDAHISRRSLTRVYVALAAGLAVGALLGQPRERG
ncbi:hypothetical protein [Paraburkholderia sp. SIMBA_054]|uniref:hypothetical protein n=1 Tax=Paraburkholderia sp. SIMBA_054 TaxID=3085795 RepID=UPI00397BCBB9